jgi:hypothetical protein
MLILGRARGSEADAARLRRHAAAVEDLARSHYQRSALAASADAYLALKRIAVALEDETLELRAPLHGACG